ncbi:hypothetical protein [Mycobacterium sp.]|uniref:hypothetical protein n=1 Tax=Mycobacterium sp. TaxID=1785 RepID=UPI002C1C9A32|nr:hypothetical protein [Mycobacterium sp.]HME46750.1 hypothetical protein [Mycobacterium sp.]
MTESPEPRTEPTAVETAPPAYRTAPADPRYDRHGRLYAALAWVGIVAGVVFIVAIVFFSGFALGRHAGGGYGGHHHHHWQGAGMSHHGGPPPMATWRSPGGQFGPGGPGGSQSPTTAPSATPHP